jgi:hypothetical protein
METVAVNAAATGSVPWTIKPSTEVTVIPYLFSS